jgi:hypothetical protein
VAVSSVQWSAGRGLAAPGGTSTAPLVSAIVGTKASGSTAAAATRADSEDERTVGALAQCSALEQEPCLRACREDSRPRLDDVGGDLLLRREAAKGESTSLEARRA